MDITRGSLDDITRPASSERWRPGSRVSLTNASLTLRNTPTLQSSLEILLPDNLGFQDEDLEVEEYQEELDNDEGTTDEIPSKYNLNGNHSDAAADQTDQDDGEADADDLMDPKLKEAIEKMQKLDRILTKRMAREKDVKQQRLLLEQKLREELERAKPEGREEAKESADNTIKYLALKPPPKHYEGIFTEEEEVCFSPLFATQPVDMRDTRSQHSSDAASEGARSASTGNFSTSTRQTSGSNKKRINSKAKKGKRKGSRNDSDCKDETDFIQRNIQLASDASNVIAMTDDEKRRLEDLLADVEMLGDDNKQNEENLHTLQLHSVPGIGYHPDQHDMETLKDIDDKLKELMPPEDFESICSTPREINIHPSIPLTHISDLRESLDVMELGEKVLQENVDMRNQQEKLKIIEKELEKLQNRVEMEIISPSMSKAQLSELYDQFTDVSSRATSETSSIALSSPRTPRDGNPPGLSAIDASSPRTLSQSSSVSLAVSTPAQEDEKAGSALPDDVLQRLLEEARSEMTGGDDRSRLSTVQEESEPEYSITSRQSWDCMTHGNARAIMPSLPESIIRDLIKNPRVTSQSLSSSRANSSTSLSTHRESLSVTSRYSNADSFDGTPVPDLNMDHTDNGKLAQSSPRSATSGDASGKSIIMQASAEVGSPCTTQIDTELLDDKFTERQKTPCQNHTHDYLSTGDGTIPSSNTDGRNSRSSLTGRNTRSIPDERDTRLTPGGRIRRSPLDTRNPISSPDDQDHRSGERDEQVVTPNEKDLILKLHMMSQHPSVTGVKPQAMLSRSDPEASVSRAVSVTSTFRSDSRASTNTVISSSDFEYENQEETKEDFLIKESARNGVAQGPVPTPPKTGAPSRTRSKRVTPENVNDDDSSVDEDNNGGGKTFSPPFFY